MAEGRALHGSQHAHQVAADARRARPHGLDEIARVTLLRHDAAGVAIGIWQVDHVVLGRDPEDELVRHPPHVAAQDGQRRDRLDDVVARGHGVIGVLDDTVKTQQRGSARAVQRETAAGQRGSAQRVQVGFVISTPQAPHIARNGVMKGQQVMPVGHRLGMLHMGVAGHHRCRMGLGLVQQHALHFADIGQQREQLGARHHARRSGVQIIAAAPGMHTPAERAGALGDEALHLHIKVSVGVGNQALLSRSLQFDQGAQQVLPIGRREQAGLAEHQHMRFVDLQMHLEVIGHAAQERRHHVLHHLGCLLL